MLYLCGSDLESRNGMATYNLNEIAQSALSINSGSNVSMFESNAGDKAVSGLPGEDGSPQDLPDRVDDLLLNKGQVNLVLETGGCKEWHASEKPGIDISAEKLQRYSYDPAWVYHHSQPFTLENEQELSSMADKETLTDFIRWSAASFPAEKYALILWDHGGGSKTGIFVDELFDGDVLHLNELDEALAESGIHFEVIAMDACMMANLETAVALKDHANYMIGSEEMVSGNGSAYSEWLNELYIHPEAAEEIAAETDEAAEETAGEADEEAEEPVSDENRVINYSAYYYRAMCYGMIGYLEEALADYTVCIDNGYDLGNSYYQRAQVYEALGDNDSQTADLENSLKYAD